MSRRTLGARAALAAGAFLLPLLLAVGLTAAAGSPARPSVASLPVVSADELRDRFGISVDLVGVTAAGGLVQLRFTVTDEVKASAAFHDKASMPSLAVEGRGIRIDPPGGMAHHFRIVGGASYFVLYANPGGSVQAGTPVSVIVGGVRLAPIIAQS